MSEHTCCEECTRNSEAADAYLDSIPIEAWPVIFANDGKMDKLLSANQFLKARLDATADRNPSISARQIRDAEGDIK